MEDWELAYIAKTARNAVTGKGWRKKEVAKRSGLSAAHVYGFLRGEKGKLSGEKINKVLGVLGLDLAQLLAEAKRLRASRPLNAFSPNAECPGAMVAIISNEPVLKPAFFQIQPHHTAWCRFCGNVLEVECPECESAVDVGMFCPHCGVPLVEVPSEFEGLDEVQLVNECRVRNFQNRFLLKTPVLRLRGTRADAEGSEDAS